MAESKKGMGSKRTGKDVSPTNRGRGYTEKTTPSSSGGKPSLRGTKNPC